jgi:hypothetical protein
VRSIRSSGTASKARTVPRADLPLQRHRVDATAAPDMKQNRVAVEVGRRHQNSYRKIKVGQSCPGSSRPNERIALARPQVGARGFWAAEFTEWSVASVRMICGSVAG